MRRKDREVAGTAEMLEIIRQCKVCRLGLADGQRPYVVPMNFGAALEGDCITIYLHCAGEGRKLDIIRQNPAACVEFDCEHRLIESGIACGYGFSYASVIGEGKAEILCGHEDKARGLSLLMEQQAGRQFSFSPEQTKGVAVLRIRLEKAVGKRRG